MEMDSDERIARGIFQRRPNIDLCVQGPEMMGNQFGLILDKALSNIKSPPLIDLIYVYHVNYIYTVKCNIFFCQTKTRNVCLS